MPVPRHAVTTFPLRFVGVADYYVIVCLRYPLTDAYTLPIVPRLMIVNGAGGRYVPGDPPLYYDIPHLYALRSRCLLTPFAHPGALWRVTVTTTTFVVFPYVPRNLL